jgi:hypothetical protein
MTSSDAAATRELVRRAIAGATAAPLPGYEGRTMAAVYRLRTEGEEAAGSARSGGRRPRGLVLALVAGVMITVLGVSTALAQGGVLSAGLTGALAYLGLGWTTSQYVPVKASATDAGITLRATAAYADSHVVGIATRTDGPSDEYNYPQDSRLVGADGDVLVPSSGAPDRGSQNANIIFFSPPGPVTVQGAEFTLTVHRISRMRLQTVQGHKAFVPMPDATGTWVLHFRVTPTVARSTPLPTPAPGDIGDVHVSFTGFHREGAYVAGEIDLSAPTGAVMAQALAAHNGSALLDTMVTPGVQMPADYPLAHVLGAPGPWADPVHEDGLPPLGKAGPPANAVSHYEEHIVWAASKPGTYHLVIGGNGPDCGPWVVRAIQVG